MAAKESPITPSVLSWAIRQDGRTPAEVARAIHVDPTVLEGWMAGTSRPTVGQTSALAAALHRPRVFFFLPEPPAGSALPSGFRHPPGGGDKMVGSGALLEVRRAKRLQQAVSWATREDRPPEIPFASMSQDPEKVADLVRGWLRVPEQQVWRDDYAALNYWRAALEDAGVLVFSLRLGKDEVRGFASWDERAPMVVLNASTSPAVRSYTLGHELAHLTLRQATACLEPADIVVDSDEEKWCDRFSAALLMPRSAMYELIRSAGIGFGAGGIEAVRSVMSRFRVSARAAALRLRDLGYAEPGLYSEVLRVFVPGRTRESEQVRSAPRPTLRLREYGQHTVALLLGSLPPNEALSVLRITVDDARRIADEVPGVPAF
ncbi:ImmA/IrrE family metallo-endopeptidase [Kribbella sp. NBC_00482]|uniref:ImmA/IrrE family metallo-endopeptidase n=1 Tax=Kribbella sp. NBC_00482 TaxID=2975968 RepID=UPI002E193A53